MKTAQTLGGLQKECFYKRNYVIDIPNKVMLIYRVGKQKPDLYVHMAEEGSRVIKVEVLTTGMLLETANEKSKKRMAAIEEFPHSLSVRFESNKMMLVWLASEYERSIWARVF